MSDTDWPSSLHLVGSKALGGAERWVQRFAAALAARGAPVTVGVRAGSAVASLDMGGLALRTLPFRSVWDPISRAAVARLVREVRPAIVQTYMGRATRLTRLSGADRPIHIARLGGAYRLAPYRHADAWIGNTRWLCDWMVSEGMPVERVHHIYNFVDAAKPRPVDEIAALRSRLLIPDDALVMTALGRLVTVKGHGVLLSALARLPAEIDGRRWRMVLVGDGPLRGTLLRQAVRTGDRGPADLGGLAAFARCLSATGRSGGFPVEGCGNPRKCDPRGLGLAASIGHYPLSWCPRDRSPRRGRLVCAVRPCPRAGRGHRAGDG